MIKRLVCSIVLTLFIAAIVYLSYQPESTPILVQDLNSSDWFEVALSTLAR